MPYKPSKTTCIGILTAGGDCPGLNAAIRGVAKAAIHEYGMKVIGIHDGFLGLLENRYTTLDEKNLSGLLTIGGTFLGTSRVKPRKIKINGQKTNMSPVAVENAKKLQIDCLVCLGGDGTQKNAANLMNNGMDVLTLPKTIDNDIWGTEMTFGFDTGLTIATEAIDRLHTTATSHHRIIVCEIMGHKAGWLALSAGIAGGADVILIPEIPYDLEVVAKHLIERQRSGKRFSIVAVTEGAHSTQEMKELSKLTKADLKKREELLMQAQEQTMGLHCHLVEESKATRLARELQQLTDTEARVTSLGHVQRGGTPTPTDRLLCTQLGTKAAELLAEGTYNVMVAVNGGKCVPVPLTDVAGKRKTVPLDHSLITTARQVGTCLGDE
jgi:6-phosphofructokinase 1